MFYISNYSSILNILITGIHGFVGSNLVTALKAQHILYGLDIVSPEKDGVIQTFGWNELNDIPPIDCIIHLAGKAHDTIEHARPQQAGILRLLPSIRFATQETRAQYK